MASVTKIKKPTTRNEFVDASLTDRNYIMKHKNDNVLSLSLLSNKFFKNLTIYELMTLSNHSEKFVRDAVLFRVKHMLYHQNDVQKMVSTKEKLMQYLNKLDKNIGDKLQVSSYKYIVKHFPHMIPRSQKLMDTNGSEPVFRTELWRAQIDLIKSNNCYAYALNQKKTKRLQKIAPGNIAKKRLNIRKELLQIKARTLSNCTELKEKILLDISHEEGYELQYNESTQVCQTPIKGFYRIALVVSESDKNNLRDFHFYRQNQNGLWSHKRGWFTGPLAVDADNKLILNPALANRKYEKLNYNEFCCFIACPSHM